MFPREVMALLDRTREVTVETRVPGGARHRVVIWIVVVNDVPYVASYRGTRGRWWRELTKAGAGTLIIGRRRLDVSAHRVRSEATKRTISAAFGRKYARSTASLAAMRTPEVLATALRLGPA